MSKIIQPIVAIGAAVGLAIVTGGLSIAPTIAISAGAAAAIGAAAISAAAGLLLKPKTPHSILGQIDRLNATINPSAPRKLVQGRTAMRAEWRP